MMRPFNITPSNPVIVNIYFNTDVASSLQNVHSLEPSEGHVQVWWQDLIQLRLVSVLAWLLGRKIREQPIDFPHLFEIKQKY